MNSSRLLLVLFFFSLAWSNTPLQSLRGSVVLRKDESPYRVTTHLISGAADTFFVEPGVEVLVDNYAKIILRGTVIIRGTEQEPVRFSASNIEDGWIGLHFATHFPVQAEFFVVENAFRNTISAAGGELSNCRFLSNYYGIWVETSQPLRLKNCELSNNRYGMAVAQGSVDIYRSHITKNAFGLYLESGAGVQASTSQIEGNRVLDIKEEETRSAGFAPVPKKVIRAVEARF